MSTSSFDRATGMIARNTPALLLAAAALLIAGGVEPACAGKPKPSKMDEYAPHYAQEPMQPAQPNGSIFQVANGYTPLTSGARASSVGDVITITLVERTQASKSNSAATGRTGSIGLTPPATGPFSFFKDTDVSTGGTNSFNGKGQAEQSNQLSGEITVTIEKVFPNGTMLVRGQKSLMLNRGDEYITITGLIRGADITPDNRILSTRVADAKIAYTGKGELARASRQGWLQRFFTMISPF
ncbi:MAG: flagellar basal body L-ring protein FlgH [Sphingobium sp.]|nr:flagellar basal body L-ring protein FlgH [Sphingobium sp.]